MRIDLPTCGFKSCRYCFDGNCTNKVEYNKCEYKMQSIVVRCKDCKYAYYYNEEDCRGLFVMVILNILMLNHMIFVVMEK